GSGPGDGSHRIQPDDDRAAWIHRQLEADLAAAQQLAEQRALALGQPDEDPAVREIDGRPVVLAAVDPEAPPELVHRDVGPALDEPSELGRGARTTVPEGRPAARRAAPRRRGPLL